MQMLQWDPWSWYFIASSSWNIHFKHFKVIYSLRCAIHFLFPKNDDSLNYATIDAIKPRSFHIAIQFIFCVIHLIHASASSSGGWHVAGELPPADAGSGNYSGTAAMGGCGGWR